MKQSWQHTERNLDYARRLVADLPQDQMAVQPQPAMNHPAWVLGHLARTTDFAASFFGVAPAVPKAWEELFKGGSKPTSTAAYPDKATLLQTLEGGHARVAEALRKAGPAALEQPPSNPKLCTRFPTTAHAVVHILIAHENMHLGQLSAWRRVQGLPAV